jgi:hypothetical protein
MNPEEKLKRFHIEMNKVYRPQYHILYSRSRRQILKSKKNFQNVLNQIIITIDKIN